MSLSRNRIALLAALIVVFALGLTVSAQAVTLPGTVPTGAPIPIAGPEGEGEDEDGTEEELETDQEAGEECEAVEDEEGGLEEECEEAEEATPPECLLSTATATVTASPARDTVRISVRYTARSSAAVEVAVKLRGGRGGLGLGADQTRFKRSGTFHRTERLTEAQMVKVLAAKTFAIELQALNTPRYCHRYFDRELSVKRGGGGGPTWSESEASKRSHV